MQENTMYNTTTQKIKAAAISVSNFLLNNPQTNKQSPINLYNQWSRENNIDINNSDISLWILEYISIVKDIDLDLLDEAVRLDTNLSK